MPEMTVQVRWPDGREEDYYSPSLVMHDHLDVGTTYQVADFVHRTDVALQIASDRVKDKFGFACTSAAATRDQIARSSAAYGVHDEVVVLRMWPPLPVSATSGTTTVTSPTPASVRPAAGR